MHKAKESKIYIGSVIIIIVFVLMFCSEPSNKFAISLSDPKSINLSLSDVSDDIRYIKLKTEIPIQHIHHIENTDSFIFISCHPTMILKFDKSGEYIQQIGNKGKGPAEYLRSLSFAIDTVTKMVIVLANSTTLKFYNFSGTYIKSVNLKGISDFSQVFMFKNNKLLLTKGNAYGTSDYNWVITDYNGNLHAIKKNFINFHLSQYIALNPSYIVCKHDNNFYYYETFNDTIFKIKEEDYFPEYIFLKDKFRMTPERYKIEAPNWVKQGTPTQLAEGPKYYHLRNIFYANDYVWIEYSLDNYSQLAIIDRKSNKLFAIRESGIMSGLSNDFDGGISFYPVAYFEENNEEFFISWIDAYKLKEHVSSEAFKNSTPKYPTKKKELEHLANSLNENDNPVLMLVKIK